MLVRKHILYKLVLFLKSMEAMKDSGSRKIHQGHFYTNLQYSGTQTEAGNTTDHHQTAIGTTLFTFRGKNEPGRGWQIPKPSQPRNSEISA